MMLLALLLAAAPVVTAKSQVDGLDLVVVQTGGARCSARLVVRAGGLDDPAGSAGLAHLVEHLAFGGAAGRDLWLRARSSINAHTSADATVFELDTDSDSCADELGALLRTLSEGRFKTSWFTNEIEVVGRESLYSGSRRSSLEFSLFGWSHDSVIGTNVTRALVKKSDALAFFTAHYTPSNMSLVVVGKVDPERISEVARVDLHLPPAPPSEWKTREVPTGHIDSGERVVSDMPLGAVIFTAPLDVGDVAMCRYGAELLRLRLTQKLERATELNVECGTMHGRLMLMLSLTTGLSNREKVKAVALKEWRELRAPNAAEQAMIAKRFNAQLVTAQVDPSSLAERIAGTASWLRSTRLHSLVDAWANPVGFDAAQLDALRAHTTERASLALTGRVLE